MLHYFRRYEKVIYAAITAVTILSFTFFGTYGTLSSPEIKDEPLFHSVDGGVVKRQEVEKLSRFLSSDLFESILSGSPLGANFLNDGVIRKDFIESGIGPLMIRHLGTSEVVYPKERYFKPYRHPETPIVSAEGIWSQFAPRLKTAFDNYKRGNFKNSEEAFRAKSNLYLMESTFPHPMLRQVLAFQFQQQKWLKPDPSLNQTDLALFGYHSTRDWFGDAFLKRCSEVVLNVARKAQAEGYRVSNEAAEADLIRNGEIAYHSHRRPEVAKTVNDFIRQELRLLGMDIGEASELWRSVLLFRSYLKDHTSSVVNEGTLLKPFFEGEHEELVVETHTLPSHLALNTFHDLQLMESYLEGVALGETYPFPQEWKSSLHVAAEFPELVLKTYRVEVKEISLKQIGALIPLKEVWAFEKSHVGRAELIKSFPAIALTTELDSETQKRVDQKARLLLVENDVAKMEEALASAQAKEMTLSLYKKGGRSPLKGIEAASLLEKLEDAQEVFTVKGEGVIYQIKSLQKEEEWKVASFSEAREAGQLDRLVEARLNNLYNSVKETLYADKTFAEIKEELAEGAYRGILHKLKKVAPQLDSPDLLAGYRFAAYLEQGESKNEDFAPYAKTENIMKGQEGPMAYVDLLRLPKGEISKVVVKGGLPLYVKVISQGTRDFTNSLATSLSRANHLVEEAARQALFDDLLIEISSKGAYTKSDV